MQNKNKAFTNKFGSDSKYSFISKPNRDAEKPEMIFMDIPEREVEVRLDCTGELVPESGVEFINIYSNIYEEDVLVFKCPECGQVHESLRLG